METLFEIQKLIALGQIIVVIELVGIFFSLVWSIVLFLIWLDLDKKLNKGGE